MGQVDRQPFHPRALQGYVLEFAARLETHLPHLVLSQLFAADRPRQIFAAASATIDLDNPEMFLRRIQEYAPGVFAEGRYLDPLAQIARALILMKPAQTLQALYGSCPAGLVGLLARVGGAAFYRKELYRVAFELFARPDNRKRAKALGQIQGLVRPEHILMASELDAVLLHRAILERAKPAEVAGLNAFVRLLPTLCDASESDIRDSLDQLPTNVRGVKIGEWAQTWLKRQVRLPVPVPIPDNDPDLKVRIGAEQESLGRRFRNCAGSLLSFSFLGERVLVEWTREGDEAVADLALVRAGLEYRWQCETLFRPRNRRVSATVAGAIRQRFDELGILYRIGPLSSDDQPSVHALLDHFPSTTFIERPALPGGDDQDVERLLDELETELHGEEAA